MLKTFLCPIRIIYFFVLDSLVSVSIKNPKIYSQLLKNTVSVLCLKKKKGTFVKNNIFFSPAILFYSVEDLTFFHKPHSNYIVSFITSRYLEKDEHVEDRTITDCLK